jgi:opacity protein-like surface antigen
MPTECYIDAMKAGLVSIVLALVICAAASAAHARPQKGFHTGPYLALEGGISYADFDVNQRTNERVGTVVEPNVGFIFGWNVYDWLAAEMSGRYSTSEKRGHREHIANANLTTKAFLITNALTNFKTLRILPYAKAGLAMIFADLPEDETVSATNTRFTYGFGPTVGAGVMFLFKKYVYLGINAQSDLLFLQDTRSSITSGGTTTSTLIYKGSFQPQFYTSFVAGVHF